MDDERSFNSVREVKYVLKKSTSKNKILTITFSGFSTLGSPPFYNYVKTLNDVDCNRLFILDDFGSRGSYYLGENGDLSIEQSVIELIKYVSEEINIPQENIITCGSSKGGYAALYYAIKYGYGSAVVGSPQIFLGKYLFEWAKIPEVAKFISGDILNSQEYLDDILEQVVLSSESKPKLYIHVGKGEYHYTRHVLPFIEWLNYKRIPYELDLGDYSTHAEVANYFPAYLNSTIKSILGYPKINNLYPDKVSPQRINTKIKYNVEALGEKLTYAWYIYKDRERISTKWYSGSNILEWKPSEPGNYQIRVFAQNENGYKESIISQQFLVE